MIQLTDGRLEALFDEQTGSLRRLTDRVHSQILAQSDRTDAFRLEYGQNEFRGDYGRFTASAVTPGSARFQWDIEPDVRLISQIRLADGQLTFRADVQNESSASLCSIEYPILNGFGPLRPGKDYLAHAYATGYLIRDPFENFPNDGDGMRYMPYPEGFSGATMQFFTYYSEGATGLYFAATDGACRQKWLNFYRRGDALCASQIFGYEDIGPGKGLEMGWDFVVRLIGGDGWYEAAELYRDWALGQKWCARGRLEALPDSQKAKWLLEETGAATFGINASHDRSRWVERYSRDIGTPIFHILGPDWPKAGQDYRGNLPGGYDDWFPARFDAKNIETIRKYGGRFAPFEFDFLSAVDKADRAEIQASLQQWPELPKAKDGYKFHMLCPLCGYTKWLHVERDREVVRESGCDAMYYDISANNILKTCMSPDHGHPVGAGAAMTEAYRGIYGRTRAALSEDSGKYVPLGAEMINETLLNRLDFYQARANAQPCSALETWPFRHLLKAGKAEVVPLFQYVYGGYAPVRLDGWGKLTAESGDLVYHTIAKTYLWGGLFEINSEYSPMEAIDETGENPSGEHYCELTPRGYAYQPELAAYLAKFAALRTGRFNRYLAYGRMLHPPAVKCRKTLRSYFQYNYGEGAEEQNDRGEIALDSVLAARYENGGRRALFLANTTASPQEVTLSGDSFGAATTCGVCRNYGPGRDNPAEERTADFRHIRLEPLELAAAEWILSEPGNPSRLK